MKLTVLVLFSACSVVFGVLGDLWFLVILVSLSGFWLELRRLGWYKTEFLEFGTSGWIFCPRVKFSWILVGFGILASFSACLVCFCWLGSF